MKCMILLALVAAVAADPYFYSNFGYSGYYGLGHRVYSPLGYSAYSPGVSHTVLHKREAEPFYYGYPYATAYAHHYAPHAYHAGTYGIKAAGGTYSNDAVSPWGYAAKGRYVAHSAGATHIAKREADPYFYSAYPYTTYPYAHTYAAPIAHTYAATPLVHHSVPVVTGMKTYSNDAVKPFNYAAKGAYHADSLGAKHIAKREAEPFYYSHVGYPYATAHSYVHPQGATTVVGNPMSYIKYFH